MTYDCWVIWKFSKLGLFSLPSRRLFGFYEWINLKLANFFLGKEKNDLKRRTREREQIDRVAAVNNCRKHCRSEKNCTKIENQFSRFAEKAERVWKGTDERNRNDNQVFEMRQSGCCMRSGIFIAIEMTSFVIFISEKKNHVWWKLKWDWPWNFFIDAPKGQP